MDSGSIATTVACNAQDRKRQKSNEGEDIISNLPESLISQILSCLPTSDAVRTSVLSKAWMWRWTRVTKLEFDDKVFDFVTGKRHFIDFVNRALILTGTSNVESFHLTLASYTYDPTLVNSWISGILQRDVKKLNISRFRHDFSVVSSHLLFNYCSLEELVLNMRSCAIRVPKSHAYFRNLKFLDLTGITFIIDLPSGSKDIILDLPVLKEFKIKDYGAHRRLSAECVTLKVPLLDRLVIEDSCNRRPTSSSCEHCAINICAVRMTEFTCVGYTSQDILLANPSSADGVVANITLYKCKEATMQEAVVGAHKFLEQFSQAKCLKLKAPELLSMSNGFLTDLPQFGMLSHLELEFSFDCEKLLCLLNKSPFLKTLDIEGLNEFAEEILNSADVPNCLLSTLEVVKFRIFCGSNHELCLAKFFLKNALVLKWMSFTRSKWYGNSKDIQKSEEVLFSFKKGCSSAILDFDDGY